MVLHKINQFDLSENQEGIVEKIKDLKLNIDILCGNLINSLHQEGVDVETLQDVMYYSGMIDIVGRVNVNRMIKDTYKLNWRTAYQQEN